MLSLQFQTWQSLQRNFKQLMGGESKDQSVDSNKEEEEKGNQITIANTLEDEEILYPTSKGVKTEQTATGEEGKEALALQ